VNALSQVLALVFRYDPPDLGIIDGRLSQFHDRIEEAFRSIAVIEGDDVADFVQVVFGFRRPEELQA